MTRHDDQEQVAAERLRHGVDRALHAHGACDLVIGARFAPRDRAYILVDALVEVRHAGKIQRDLRHVGIAAAQQRDDAFDGDFGVVRWALLARLGIEVVHPPPGFQLAGFGQLHAPNAKAAPCDAAPADCTVEDCEPVPRHFYATYPTRIITLSQRTASGILRFG